MENPKSPLLRLQKSNSNMNLACTDETCKKLYELVHNGCTVELSILSNRSDWTVDNKSSNQSIREQSNNNRDIWVDIICRRLFNLVFIYHLEDHHFQSRFFVLYIIFLFWTCILLDFIRYEGQRICFPIYLLHYLILCSSATNRWKSHQILCPSYQIKSSNIEDVRYNGMFCVETRRSSTKKQP